MADAPALMGSIQMMVQMAAMSGGKQKVVTIKTRKAVLELDAENKSGTLTILLSTPNSMLTLRGNGVTKADLVDVFGGALDLDGLEKTIAE